MTATANVCTIRKWQRKNNYRPNRTFPLIFHSFPVLSKLLPFAIRHINSLNVHFWMKTSSDFRTSLKSGAYTRAWIDPKHWSEFNSYKNTKIWFRFAARSIQMKDYTNLTVNEEPKFRFECPNGKYHSS